MVLSPLELAALILLPLLCGAAVLRALGLAFRTDPIGHLGWAWLIGSLLLGALELLRLLSGVGSPGGPAVAALALAGALWIAGRRRPALARRAREESVPARSFFLALLALALAVTANRVVAASWDPILRGDEALFWSKRAKLWFEAGGFGGVYARTLAERDLANAGYPFLNPLLQLWAFDLAGRITHVVNRVPIQLCSLALVLCTASALRRTAGAWLGGALLLLLPSSFPATYATGTAHADVLSALGVVVAFDAYLRWHDEGERAWLGLASLATAFVAWSKNEGLLFAASFVAAHVLVHRRAALAALRRPTRAHLWWLPPLCVVAVTWVHNAVFHATATLAPDPEHPARLVARFATNLPLVLDAFGRSTLDPGLNQVPAACLVALLVPESRRGKLGVGALALVLVYLGLALVYIGCEMDLMNLLGTTLWRVLFQLLPLELVWIGAVVTELRARGGAVRTA